MHLLRVVNAVRDGVEVPEWAIVSLCDDDSTRHAVPYSWLIHEW